MQVENITHKTSSLSKKIDQIESKTIEKLIEENSNLRLMQTNDIHSLCDKLKSIKSAVDSYHLFLPNQSTEKSTPLLKKRSVKELGPINFDNSTEMKTLKDEIEVIKKENDFQKTERKNFSEIIKLQNQVIKDLNKQWDTLSSSLKEFKKSGITNQIDKILQTVFYENTQVMPNSLLTDIFTGGDKLKSMSIDNSGDKSNLATFTNLNIKTNMDRETCCKSTQTFFETKSIGVQNLFDIDDGMKSDWVQLKKKQSKCMGKIEQMVKLVNAMVTLEATNKHIKPNPDNETNDAGLSNTNLNENNIGIDNLKRDHNNPTNLADKENLSYSSELDFEENCVEKNFSFQSSEGRTSFTIDTQNFTNEMHSETKGVFSGGKQISQFKKPTN